MGILGFVCVERTRKIGQGNNLEQPGWNGPPKADRDPGLSYWIRRCVLSARCTTSQTKVTLEPLGVKMAPLLRVPPPVQEVAWTFMVAKVTLRAAREGLEWREC